MKKIILFTLVLIGVFGLASCEKEVIITECESGFELVDNSCLEIDFDSMYPENGVYYQLFVRSFADSDNDGIGDFNGITENLDYFVEMGIDSIWLMPIHPSPTYHGYDVLDYYDVNPEYGTMEDFEKLLEESEKLGINIILDLVLNHTSRQHPWFTAWASGDPEYAGYYRKVLTSDSRYEDNPGLWHALGDGYYYAGFFGSSMPDLNWSNPNVQNEMVNIGKYWLEKGVDGFRLDAALHLEDYGEVLPGTVPIDSTLTKLEWFEYQLEAEYPDVYIVGEVWSNFSEFSLFYQSMDSALNFETGGNIVSVINRGYSTDYVSSLLNDYATIHSYGDNKLDAPFLYNHDQDRIASILNGNIPKLKLAAEMLLTLEGNPFIYYGEELGMFGVKTYGPDIWDETRRLPFLFDNEYQTSWIEDTYNMNVGSVSEQLADPNSLLNTYKSILNVRQNSLALKYGTLLECPYADNALQGYYRDFYYDETTNQRVLVLHNVTDGDYVFGEIEGTVIYYSNGLENYDGTIEARSTVIIEVPYES